MDRKTWDSSTIDKRRGAVWNAGFTRDAANRYSDRSWDNLPFYIQEALARQADSREGQ